MFRLSLTRPLVLLGFPLGDVGPGNMTPGGWREGEGDDHRAAYHRPNPAKS
jgi:hypothetical protein